MRNISIIILLIYPFILSSQTLTDSIIIKFDSSLTYSEKIIERCKAWTWIINGKETFISKEKNIFPIHDSGFDTIVFIRAESKRIDTIVTKFTSNNEYIINYNHCCHTFDIYLSKTYSYYIDLNKKGGWGSADSVKNSNESSSVSFRIRNYYGKHKMVGAFGDIFGEYTGGGFLKNDDVVKKGFPFRSGYSDNVDYIIIGTIEIIDKDTLVENWYEKEYHVLLNDNDVYLEGRFINEFVKFQCRFFNKEKIFIDFDYKTGKFAMKIE